MATTPCTATVRGLAGFPLVNVRVGAGTHTALAGTMAVGTANLKVLDVRPDELKKELNGKIYQWFRLELPDGKTGWIRDDLLEIRGDCSVYGYGLLSESSFVFALSRVERQPPTDTQERIRKAAFNITAGFEGGGYASYQNFDAGIVSFGRFQFTLASGSLFSVLDCYLVTATNRAVADELRASYSQRVKDRDPSLRDDTRLRDLLIQAANDEAMKKAQDLVATEVYWQRLQDLSITPRQIKTPLGQAFLFDCGIHHGLFHNMIGLAEKVLGVAPKSRLGENGTTEEKLIIETAKIRRDRLHALADRMKLEGLRRRGEVWFNVVNSGDWNLQGDSNGEFETYVGKRVQVRMP